jgi:methylated-DNA-[protein]-cysteine S-methyltransferase
MLAKKAIETPIGELLLFARGDELVWIQLPDSETPPPDGDERDAPILKRTAKQLAEYFHGERFEFDLPLALEGTGFQQRVWQELTKIPFAATWSYGQLAKAIGKPSASRAVGAANGRNPISIIVPCHRVIGSNGALTGYGGGMKAKQWLLEHERKHAPTPRAGQVALSW